MQNETLDTKIEAEKTTDAAAQPPQPPAVADHADGTPTPRTESLLLAWSSMRVTHLFFKFTLYYAAITAIVLGAVAIFPALDAYLPIGGAAALLGDGNDDPFKSIEINATKMSGLRDSLAWMAIAITGAILTIWPVSWTYMAIRKRSEYDQSLIETIMVLPIAVTSLVILVHDSLALAFSLGGIVAVVRFRNTLKSTGDALYVLVAIGIGLAAGIGAMEVAIVMSMAFNYCFLILWGSDYGARKGTHRYMRKAHKKHSSQDDEDEEAVESSGD